MVGDAHSWMQFQFLLETGQESPRALHAGDAGAALAVRVPLGVVGSTVGWMKVLKSIRSPSSAARLSPAPIKPQEGRTHL